MTTTEFDYIDQRIDTLREISLDISSLEKRPKGVIFRNMAEYYSGMKLCISLLCSVAANECDSEFEELSKAFDEAVKERGIILSEDEKVLRYCETFDVLYSKMINILESLRK